MIQSCSFSFSTQPLSQESLISQEEVQISWRKLKGTCKLNKKVNFRTPRKNVWCLQTNETGSCKLKPHCRKEHENEICESTQKCRKNLIGDAKKSVEILEKLKKASLIKSVHYWTKKDKVNESITLLILKHDKDIITLIDKN